MQRFFLNPRFGTSGGISKPIHKTSFLSKPQEKKGATWLLFSWGDQMLDEHLAGSHIQDAF